MDLVRDDRNAGSALAPAVWFAFSPDRKGIHPQTHLAGFSGVLQAYVYAEVNELYQLNDVDAESYLGYGLGIIADGPVNRVSEVLPWRITLPTE